MKKALEWLGWSLLTVLVAAVGFVMWAGNHGWEFDAVLSGSMEPVYNVGGLVVFHPVDVATLEIGDIISFKLPDISTPICHRIVDTEVIDGESYFITKGDANEEADPDPVPASAVAGKGVFHVPYIGRLDELKNLGTTMVAFLGMRLPAATLIVLGLGLVFIGLTVKDTLEDIIRPQHRRRRELLKKRDARLAKRRQAFK